MTTSLSTGPSPDWLRTGVTLLERGLASDYRFLPRVSNSDLTRLKEEHLGRGPANAFADAQAASERTQLVGKAFHQHLLAPASVGTVLEQLLPDLTHSGYGARQAAHPTPDKLLQAVRRDSFCGRYLRLAERCVTQPALNQSAQGRAERERVVLFTDPATQVACKARLKLLYTSAKRQQALVIDVKTTAARTQAQFLQSCYNYDYDRQAAFYLDSLRYADSGEWAATRRLRFVLVGVMHQQPDRLFAIDATSLPGFIDYGRKKYRFWLKKWQETNAGLD